MVSVRQAVEPLNRALGNSTTIFLQGSFVGLPLINQALAAENPILAGKSFFVTVRALIKVLEAIPIDSVLKAVKAAAEASTSGGSKSGGGTISGGGKGGGGVPTIIASTEGKGSATILIVKGTGFLPNKTITVRVADEQLDPERNFQQTSTEKGEFSMRIALPCNSGASFHVSATDSRPGPGILGVLFSNNITLPCP
jgi:L-aminopeptidase/D-esterase-like protein